MQQKELIADKLARLADENHRLLTENINQRKEIIELRNQLSKRKKPVVQSNIEMPIVLPLRIATWE